LAKARNLVAVDAAPVWSVPCFFVKRGWRGRGLAGRLLQAAAEWARQAGAPSLEGYPIDSQVQLGDAFVYTGAYSTFARLGFAEVARKHRTRPVMRLSLRRRGPGDPWRVGRSAAPRDVAVGAKGSAGSRGRPKRR
jgi:GNAT superfamily N-acetyltransferase